MQRLPWTAKTRRDSSGKAPNSCVAPAGMHLATGMVRCGLFWICLVLLAGCSRGEEGPDGQTGTVPETQEPAARDDIRPPADDDERSVEQKVTDASLAAKVRIGLVEDRSVRAFEIEPVVVNGRVVLRGRVETLAQRTRAESIAAGVEGVRSVVNEITSVETPAIAERVPEEGEEERSEAPDQSVETSDPGATYHTVRYGDNLWDIARAYGVSVDQIRRLNGLQSNAIRPGDELQVK